MAIVASLAIFFSIIISCVGTQRFIGTLVHSPRVVITWREKFRELSGTLTNRSFLALTISGVIGGGATRLRQGLDFFISAYFFFLTPPQISYLFASPLVAALVAVVIAPALSHRV